mmetsp:Transcript_20902/g.63934  ORF Transcript_20902/g.63934 Transcript_20902/m.63934 type:complete len:227 (-) Transcript_20902:353-1033(-)
MACRSSLNGRPLGSSTGHQRGASDQLEHRIHQREWRLQWSARRRRRRSRAKGARSSSRTSTSRLRRRPCASSSRPTAGVCARQQSCRSATPSSLAKCSRWATALSSSPPLRKRRMPCAGWQGRGLTSIGSSSRCQVAPASTPTQHAPAKLRRRRALPGQRPPRRQVTSCSCATCRSRRARRSCESSLRPLDNSRRCASRRSSTALTVASLSSSSSPRRRQPRRWRA